MTGRGGKGRLDAFVAQERSELQPNSEAVARCVSAVVAALDVGESPSNDEPGPSRVAGPSSGGGHWAAWALGGAVALGVGGYLGHAQELPEARGSATENHGLSHPEPTTIVAPVESTTMEGVASKLEAVVPPAALRSTPATVARKPSRKRRRRSVETVVLPKADREPKPNEFAAELRLIAAIKRHMDHSEWSSVRAGLAEHRQRFAGGAFIEEREFLAIEVACRTGRSGARLLRNFRRRFPKSVLLDKLDQECLR